MADPHPTERTDDVPFFPYPPIGEHGVVGDRRTAALVAADGTIDWCCLPNYDGAPVFGALLDVQRGGYWRFGPEQPTLGHQTYLDGSAALVTTWETADGRLELTDAMAWPADERTVEQGGDGGRVVIRRLRCVDGRATARMEVRPRADFDRPARAAIGQDGVVFEMPGVQATLWTSRPLVLTHGGAGGRFELAAGDDVWSVLAHGEAAPRSWSVERAQHALDETVRYWHEWSAPLRCGGKRAAAIRRSALTIQLLSYAPTGSPVAAPTSSLPERIGGDRNWDYRYAWVRDASLAGAMLSQLGDTESSRRYIDCLSTYRSSTDSPLQVVYGIDGGLHLPERERHDLAGYCASRPVRFGNGACGQRQLDSLGFFVISAHAYLDQSGECSQDLWHMVCRAVDYTIANWTKPDSGVWEMRTEAQFVSSKVMSWAVLDCATKIASLLDREDGETREWRTTMDAIHAEVMERGWSERLGAFRQHYDADSLDASALLIPLVRFLPADHPRVLATIDRILDTLTIDGLVHRYVPREIPNPKDFAVGDYEGAFIPCTCWLATALTMAGRTDEADAILTMIDTVAGELGLLAEEIDARSGTFLGNVPLVFSHAEYIRAAMAIDEAGRDQR